MKLHDTSFLDRDGEPIIGRVPAVLNVYGNDGKLNAFQQGAVAHAYKLFKDALRIAQTDFLTQHRVLEDGTRVRLLSINGADTVQVFPPAAAGLKFDTYPAFWFNAPGIADSMPDPVHSGTWTNLPYVDGGNLVSKEDFWKVHPGNRTWRNSRADSKSKGIVLSWWGLGKDRYSADHFTTDTALSDDAFPYGKLYCNGIKIGDFTSSTTAIMGACVCEVDGVLKITAVTAPWTSHSSGPGTVVRQYGTYGFTTVDDVGAAAVITTPLVLTTHQAKLPAAFQVGNISTLTFSTVNVVALAGSPSGDPFTKDAELYAFYAVQPPLQPPTLGIHFNSSGTEGIVNTGQQRAIAYPEGTSVRADVFAGVRIDPRTGALGDGVAREVCDLGESDCTDPAGFFADYTGFSVTISQTRPCYALDYEDGADSDPDELVWVAQRVLNIVGQTDPGDVNNLQFLQHSKYGVLLYDSFVDGAPSSSDFFVSNRRWSMTGDLRLGLTHLTGVLISDPTDVLMVTFLKDVRLDDVTLSTGYESFQTGYEGTDSSFDGRMIVDRAAGAVKVYVDGTDVTDDITDERLQDIKYPVLCGPIQFKQGRKDAKPSKYVAGEAP